MTDASPSAAVTAIPRLYGAGELGVLSVTAPGAAHPRVEYIGGELFVGLDVDGVALTQGQADALPEPFGQIAATAAASAPALPMAQDGVVVIDDEATATAALLDPSRIPADAFAGAPVVFALSRTRVALVGAQDEAGVGRVLDLADEVYEAGGPVVSAHPLVRAEGAWAPFAWHERLPSLAMRFERMLRLFSVRAYEAQTAALKRPDVQYIDPKIRVLDSGVTTTFATWPKGVASLLPVVDNVIVADRSGALSVTTMAQFLEAGGDAIVRTGLSPARYFVPGDQPRG